MQSSNLGENMNCTHANGSDESASEAREVEGLIRKGRNTNRRSQSSLVAAGDGLAHARRGEVVRKRDRRH